MVESCAEHNRPSVSTASVSDLYESTHFCFLPASIFQTWRRGITVSGDMQSRSLSHHDGVVAAAADEVTAGHLRQRVDAARVTFEHLRARAGLGLPQLRVKMTIGLNGHVARHGIRPRNAP